MGPFVPALAALGGGSAVAGGITLATTAVGVMSAMEQAKAGSEARAEAKSAAQREAISGREEEIQRRRELQRVLAARNAAAGAGGVTTDGSIGTLTRTDIRDNRNDLLTAGYNSSSRQRALRSQGTQAKRVGNMRAAGSLLDTAKGVYDAVPH
jgi:hypothetical protein